MSIRLSLSKDQGCPHLDDSHDKTGKTGKDVADHVADEYVEHDTFSSASDLSKTQTDFTFNWQRIYSAPAEHGAPRDVHLSSQSSGGLHVDSGEGARQQHVQKCLSSDSLDGANDTCPWQRQSTVPAARTNHRDELAGDSSLPMSTLLARRFSRFRPNSLRLDVCTSISRTKTESTIVPGSASLYPRILAASCETGFSRSASIDVSTDDEPQSRNGTRLRDVYETSYERLGKGAFAVVFAGRSKDSGEQVALKTMFSSDPEAQQTARREWEILSSLTHPNVVLAYGLYCTHKKMILVLQRLPGVSLREAVATSSGGHLSECSSQQLGKSLLEAVAYLHSECIVHRDIKSSNVIVELNKLDLHLIDFNCSRRLPKQEGDVLTPFGGSSLWSAPEVLLGSSSISTANDVWAVGLCLHVMLLGSLPSEHRRLKDTRALGRCAKRLLLDALHSSSFSSACKNIVCLCLEGQVIQRPSAVELLADPWFAAGSCLP